MNRSLKFISISHHTTSLIQQECFHLTPIRQYQWFGLLRRKFTDISGLMILSTCNRTEIYLESKETKAEEIRDFFSCQQREYEDAGKAELFATSNSTMKTMTHLLEVGNGLQSVIIGDLEIMGQLKKAWQQSIQLNAQGSLLERAIQAAFRTHKRAVNDNRYKLTTIDATATKNPLYKLASVKLVERIIKEEVFVFSVWLKRQAVRELLIKCTKPNQHLSRYSPLNIKSLQKLNTKEFERLVNRISDKLVKETPMAVFRKKPDEISAQNLTSIVDLVTTQQNQYEENRSISC